MKPGLMKQRGAARYVRWLALATAVLGGCSATWSPHGGAGAKDEQPAELIGASDRTLVLPLRDGSCLPVYGNHVMCHLTGEHLDAGVVPKGTGAELGTMLFQKLQTRHVSLIPYAHGLELLSRADAALVDRYAPSLAVQLGQQAHASKVIMGVVARYDERSGSWFGSREPAAVAFSLALVDVATGTVTHTLRFKRRQVPLTTNLFALPTWWRNGFAWWTRKAIADQALAESADALLGVEPAPPLWTNMPAHPSAYDALDGQTEQPISP